MAIICYPRDNMDFVASDAGAFFATRTSGVYSADTNLAVSINGARQLSVSPGIAWIRTDTYWGKVIVNTADIYLTLPDADGVLDRICRIVARWDKTANELTIILRQGDLSVTPVAPARNTSDELYELVLADYLVQHGETSASASRLTDQRLNENLCGLMRDGVTGIPTSSLETQAEQLIEDLREAFEAVIAENVPAHAFTHAENGTDPITMSAAVTITLTATDDASMAGQIITIKNAEDDSTYQTITYDGQPASTTIPIAMVYRVEVNAKTGYVTPDAVEYTAVANSTRAITMSYQYGRRWGFSRAKTNSSPSSRIEYLYDAVGMTPGAMNFTTGEFAYGSWQAIINEFFRPVMQNYDGSVAYELDHDDQTKKLDGTASDITSTAFAGNAMVEIKTIYIKRYEDGTKEYVILSDVAFDSSYKAYAHTNEQGNIKPAFYWRMFKGSNVSSKLRSIAGQGVMVSQTRNTERAYAQANGDGWDTIYNSGWQLIADMLTLIAKSDDAQTAYGAGRTLASNTAGITPGSLKSYGAFMGYTNGTTSVKTLWIEDFWGNYWEGMTGLILAGSAGIKTKMTPPYNYDGTGYTATGIVPTGTSGGYIDTETVGDTSGLVPKTANGSGSTYLCDGLWFNTSQTDYALVGGGWADALLCGPRYVNLNTLASHTDPYFGSGLSYLEPDAA